MSYIERDKISLPEIKGHLGDHITVTEQTHLHWLFAGLELNNGLRLITDDKACSFMLDSITEGGVVNIYVEDYVAQDSERSAEESYWKTIEVSKEISTDDNSADEEDHEVEHAVVVDKEKRGKVQVQGRVVHTAKRRKALVVISPSKEQEDKDLRRLRTEQHSSGKEKEVVNPEAADESKSDDSDYVGGDENSSGEDDEIKKYAKLVKRRLTYYVSSEGTGDIVPINLKIPEVVNASALVVP